MCCPVQRCGPQACCPLPRRPVDKLWPVKPTYGCPGQKCGPCGDLEQVCPCNCIRNGHILEALACLFRLSEFELMATLFQLAYDEAQPLPRFPRDRVWNVMENIKAPYTELHDLMIYDSMYDRCGLPIDPLDRTNTYKLLRMIFMAGVLVPEQRDYLLMMLRRLNAHAICPVNLEALLAALQLLKLDDLVCGLLNQRARAKRLRSGRQCADLCRLYQKVVTTDKDTVIRRRMRTQSNTGKEKGKTEAQKKPPQQRPKIPPPAAQIYCTRRHVEPEEPPHSDGATPVVQRSSMRRSSAKKAW
ncbi:hypothetical protein KR018_009556, partial [Drosophila ironensis]